MSSRVEALVIGLRQTSSRQAILDELEHYPTLRHAAPEAIPLDPDGRLVGRWNKNEWFPALVWEAADHTMTARRAAMHTAAPPYRGASVHTTIPALPTGDHLSPLMLWWALLFGLSTLARYEPASWMAALDVNSSPLAVPLEAAMNEALDSVPHLVLEALLGRFVEEHSY